MGNRIDLNWVRGHFLREYPNARILEREDFFILDKDGDGIDRFDYKISKQQNRWNIPARFEFVGDSESPALSLMWRGAVVEPTKNIAYALADHWEAVERKVGIVGGRAIYFIEGAAAAFVVIKTAPAIASFLAKGIARAGLSILFGGAAVVSGVGGGTKLYKGDRTGGWMEIGKALRDSIFAAINLMPLIRGAGLVKSGAQTVDTTTSSGGIPKGGGKVVSIESWRAARQAATSAAQPYGNRAAAYLPNSARYLFDGTAALAPTIVESIEPSVRTAPIVLGGLDLAKSMITSIVAGALTLRDIWNMQLVPRDALTMPPVPVIFPVWDPYKRRYLTPAELHNQKEIEDHIARLGGAFARDATVASTGKSPGFEPQVVEGVDIPFVGQAAGRLSTDGEAVETESDGPLMSAEELGDRLERAWEGGRNFPLSNPHDPMAETDPRRRPVSLEMINDIIEWLAAGLEIRPENLEIIVAGPGANPAEVHLVRVLGQRWILAVEPDEVSLDTLRGGLEMTDEDGIADGPQPWLLEKYYKKAPLVIWIHPRGPEEPEELGQYLADGGIMVVQSDFPDVIQRLLENPGFEVLFYSPLDRIRNFIPSIHAIPKAWVVIVRKKTRH